MAKRILLITLLLGLSLGFLGGSATAFAKSTSECEPDAEGIMKAYNGIVENLESEKSFHCLLQIHKKATGITKYLAADALRPLLGGHALAGRQLNDKTKAAVQKFQKEAMRSPDVIHESFLTDYAQGTWGFYDLFCQAPNKEFCTTFLPDEKQVLRESELIGSSSMILLREAYLKLQGQDKKFVETRIKKLYIQISKRDPLKRKVIEQIYQELFGVKIPLGSLS
jgi:hypothetical protein